MLSSISNATTREQYALRLVSSEPGPVQAGDEERGTSPAEQPGERRGDEP
ncbi:MAG: hypothetical protein ACRDGV_11785 [Candidatus Limnocylindria bacterium]